jgi:hypothetical protein
MAGRRSEMGGPAGLVRSLRRWLIEPPPVRGPGRDRATDAIALLLLGSGPLPLAVRIGAKEGRR